MHRWMEIAWVLLLGATNPYTSGQAAAPDLNQAEDQVARQFNDIRMKSGLPMLKPRRDLGYA